MIAQRGRCRYMLKPALMPASLGLQVLIASLLLPLAAWLFAWLPQEPAAVKLKGNHLDPLAVEARVTVDENRGNRRFHQRMNRMRGARRQMNAGAAFHPFAKQVLSRAVAEQVHVQHAAGDGQHLAAAPVPVIAAHHVRPGLDHFDQRRLNGGAVDRDQFATHILGSNSDQRVVLGFLESGMNAWRAA